jgi:hypothetical protein
LQSAFFSWGRFVIGLFLLARTGKLTRAGTGRLQIGPTQPETGDEVMSMLPKAVSLFVVALALVAADKTEPEPKKVAPPKADVRGEVTKVVGLRAKDRVGNVLVEGAKEKDTQYDKASVTLSSTTKFYKWVDGKKKDAKFADVKEGCKVQCVFTGPVAESYPVQATASELIILEEPKKK